MLRTILFSTILAFAASSALAASCPKIMAEVDAALTTASISDADMTRVKELRTQGETLHKSGDHAGSEAALNEAKKILGM